MAVLAHPFRYRRPCQRLDCCSGPDLGLTVIEAYYAYNNPSPWSPSMKQTHDALQLAEQLNLLVTCGTDTHGLSLLKRV